MMKQKIWETFLNLIPFMFLFIGYYCGKGDTELCFATKAYMDDEVSIVRLVSPENPDEMLGSLLMKKYDKEQGK